MSKTFLMTETYLAFHIFQFKGFLPDKFDIINITVTFLFEYGLIVTNY